MLIRLLDNDEHRNNQNQTTNVILYFTITLLTNLMYDFIQYSVCYCHNYAVRSLNQDHYYFSMHTFLL